MNGLSADTLLASELPNDKDAGSGALNRSCLCQPMFMRITCSVMKCWFFRTTKHCYPPHTQRDAQDTQSVTPMLAKTTWTQ